LIENFRPGTLDAMGLTKEALEELNLGLIVISVSGFGQDGPYRERAAFDCIAQSMSGLASLTGAPDGGPFLTGTYFSDFLSAVYAAFGAVTALVARNRTGKGQSIDIALLDALFSVLATAPPLCFNNGEVQSRWANRDKVCAPANSFRTKDGIIYIHGGTDALFKRLAEAMGRTDLLEDERFRDNERRMANIDGIEAIVEEWTSALPTVDIEEALVRAGVPVAPVNDIAAALENPQLRHRRAMEVVEYPGIGETVVPGIVLKMSDTPGRVYCPPPTLGQHNGEVLRDLLGYSAEEIEALEVSGAI
jgi:crotonobetainyl-CoA:carnitine CoA-transferase CaiB-like acyl-CoA transferase